MLLRPGLALTALLLSPGLSLAATDESGACSEVPGIEALLAAAPVVLIGELHGTRESPAFVAAVVCRATAAGKSVTVGIEWVDAESERVRAFLASDGGPEARAALLAGGIWQARGSAQYGATSEAMLALLDDLRALRRAGAEIDVFLFNRYGRGSQERDRLMAEALAEGISEAETDLFLVHTGNIHSRVAPGTPWSPDFQPMGLLLQRARPDLGIVALDVAHAGGTAWLCISGEPCGAQRQPVRGDGDGARFEIRLSPEAQANGHHGTYFVGPIEASPPAVPDSP